MAFSQKHCSAAAHGLFRPLVVQAWEGRPAKRALTLRCDLPI